MVTQLSTGEAPNAAAMSAARTVSQSAVLKSIRLVESTSTRQLYEGALPPNVNMGSELRSEFNDESGNLLVFVLCELSANRSADDDEPVLSLAARFQIHYQVGTDVAGDNAHAFARIVGMFNVWPFWREFVQSMTNRMGMPSLTIPLMDPSTVAWSETSSGATPKKAARKKARKSPKKKSAKKKAAKKKRR